MGGFSSGRPRVRNAGSIEGAARLCQHNARFASRQAHRLTYLSQTMTERDYARSRSLDLKARLVGAEWRPKPRGQNHAKLFAMWIEADTRYSELFVAGASKRLR